MKLLNKIIDHFYWKKLKKRLLIKKYKVEINLDGCIYGELKKILNKKYIHCDGNFSKLVTTLLVEYYWNVLKKKNSLELAE